MKTLLLLLALIATPAYSVIIDTDSDRDPRWRIDAPERDSRGNYKRSNAELRKFANNVACPSSGKHSHKRCKGWQIQHVFPIACGGVDKAFNMMWAHVSIKTCASDTIWVNLRTGKSGKLYCLDRSERNIYAADPPLPDTARCRNKVVE